MRSDNQARLNLGATKLSLSTETVMRPWVPTAALTTARMTLVIASLWLSCGSQGLAANEADTLRSFFLASREGIKSLNMELELTQAGRLPGGALEPLDWGAARTDYFNIRWTPESVRFDHKSAHVRVRGPGGELLRPQSGMWERRLVVSGGEFIEYSPTEYEGIGWTAANAASVSSSRSVQRRIFLPTEIAAC